MRNGEFAEVCETRISVLRHYDKEGLLPPDFIDRFTGYRYYSANQISTFRKIAAHKKSGFYEELKLILNAIYNKVNVNYYGYIHLEDQRMITAVKAVLARNIIPLEEVLEWIDGFSTIIKSGKYPEDIVIDFNVNTFLKSLYFRLLDKDEYILIANRLKDIVKGISRFS